MSPFTAAQTNLSKVGKIVASRFKFTKSHTEVRAIVSGIKDSREKTNAPPLDYLAFDNPEGDSDPYEEVWGNKIQRGIVPFEKVGSLPRLELVEQSDFICFSVLDPFEHYIMAHWDSIEKADKYVGLDTEFDRVSHELYVISISISTLPVIVLHLVGLEGRLPSQMARLLKRDEFVFCGRQAGGDCNKIEQQHGIRVKNRLELGTLALLDHPEMARVKGGTALHNNDALVIQDDTRTRYNSLSSLATVAGLVENSKLVSLSQISDLTEPVAVEPFAALYHRQLAFVAVHETHSLAVSKDVVTHSVGHGRSQRMGKRKRKGKCIICGTNTHHFCQGCEPSCNRIRQWCCSNEVDRMCHSKHLAAIKMKLNNNNNNK